jgi:hypothetical protein
VLRFLEYFAVNVIARKHGGSTALDNLAFDCGSAL